MKAKFQINDIFTVTGRGIVLSGNIVDGNISKGDLVKIGDELFPIIGVEGFSNAGGFKPMNPNVGLLIKTPDGLLSKWKLAISKHRKEIVIITDTPSIRDEKINNILK